jgi:hypothetical protein
MWVLLTCGLILAAGLARAEKFAIVCGVADYPGVINDLAYTDDDAREIADALSSAPDWLPENVHLLLDWQVTAAGVRAAINQVARQMQSGDTLCFTYSGHGSQVPDQFPFDEADFLDETLFLYDRDVTDDEVTQWFSVLPAGANLCWYLDSCFSGGFNSRASKDGATARGLGLARSARGDGFFRDVFQARRQREGSDLERTVLVAACAEDELSDESAALGNGVFTYYLLKGILGAGPADANGDDIISVEESFAYAAPLATAFNPDQHAEIYDSVAGELPLMAVIGGGEWATTYSAALADTRDLGLLRAYRDRVLLADPAGRESVRALYAAGDRALLLLRVHPEWLAQAARILGENRAALQAAAAGQTGTVRDVRPVLALLDAVTAADGGSLGNLARQTRGLIQSRMAAGRTLCGLRLLSGESKPRPKSR